MTKCETSCEYKLASLINLPKLDVQIWFWCANFNNSYTMRYQRKRWYYTWFGGLGLSNKVTWAITLGTQMQKPHATLVGWNLLVEHFLLIEWNAFANEFCWSLSYSWKIQFQLVFLLLLRIPCLSNI